MSLIIYIYIYKFPQGSNHIICSGSVVRPPWHPPLAHRTETEVGGPGALRASLAMLVTSGPKYEELVAAGQNLDQEEAVRVIQAARTPSKCPPNIGTENTVVRFDTETGGR